MSVLQRLGSAFSFKGRRDPAAQLVTLELALSREWSEPVFAELKALAAEGFAPAQFRVGQLFETAEGVIQSLPDSVYWYRLAATQGHLAAQVRLGLIFFIEPPAPAGLDAAPDESASVSLARFFPHGTAVRQDFAEALRWNRAAALQGSAEAQARLGHQLSLGLGVPVDLTEAKRWFASAADQSHAEGELGLGLLYSGHYGTPADLAAAAHWLQRAAERGQRIAQYGFGKLQLHGEGVVQDVPAALRWLEQSARQEYAPAMYLLGMAYWQGTGIAVDVHRAETWLRRAMSRGHGEGACALAQLLLSRPDDDGVEAAALFRDQAEAGNKAAAAALAELYTFGRGLPPDARQAARWRAVSESESGPAALTMLASLHAEGISVPQDFAQAAALLRAAAAQGSVDALYNLGWLYRLGKGVPQERAQAEHCWREAAQSGSREAAFQLGLLHSESDQHAAFEAAAAAFTAAAEAGDPRARANLAVLVAEGAGVERDPDRALALLREAATSGDAGAQAALGFQLLAGLAGKPDLPEVRALLERAAGGGDANAQAWMGDFFRLGLDAPADYERAESWYRQAAAQGHVGALVLLASAIETMSPRGEEVESEAFGLWLAAASAGEAVAQYHVGQRYLLGLGCDRNDTLGAQWLDQAAMQGYRPAAEPNAGK